MPEISVIVPVYNVEKYIHRCVDSILKQTFTDFELILVDDGSPDNCGKICDEYAEKDNRIKVIHKKNGGLSSARNAGLDIATGKYVMFCDSDDYVTPDWCEKLYNAIIKNPTSFIVSNIYKVIDNSIIPSCKITESSNNITYFDIYKQGLSAYAVNKIYNIELLNKYKIRFDENCFFAEDVEFNVKYYSKTLQSIYISTPIYYYISNPNGIMNTYKFDLFNLHIPLFFKRICIIQDNQLTEYCNIWIYHFITLFDNIFDKRNTEMSLLDKFRYNNKMIKSEEFQFCVENSSENKITKTILKFKNYYIFWLFQKLTSFKQKLRSNKNENHRNDTCKK